MTNRYQKRDSHINTVMICITSLDLVRLKAAMIHVAHVKLDADSRYKVCGQIYCVVVGRNRI